MYGGSSGCYGIVIYDTKKDGAVYGYYENQAMILKTGSREEMLALKSRHEEGVECEKGKENRMMGSLLLSMLVLLVILVISAPLRTFFAALVFCVISYFPILVVLFANTGLYKEESLRESFKRFHGCEHAVIHSLTKEKEADAEVLRKAPYLDAECGTAYSGYVIFLALELAVLVLVGPGLLKSIGILLLTILLLLINIFNPVNPFLLLQKPVVSKPTDYELQLGAAIMTKLREL